MVQIGGYSAGWRRELKRPQAEPRGWGVRIAGGGCDGVERGR